MIAYGVQIRCDICAKPLTGEVFQRWPDGLRGLGAELVRTAGYESREQICEGCTVKVDTGFRQCADEQEAYADAL